ncbi:MAG: Do family serine endopeptidase [Muribaculaceae bacterium]
MKQNTKFGLLLLAASVLGSATTLFATQALTKSGKSAFNDQLITADNSQANGNFIRTAARVPAVETDFTKAAESTINSVVSIKSYATPKRQQMQGGMFDPFEFFFGPNSGLGNSTPRRQQQQDDNKEENMQPLGLGSGVIITADGYIVTNNHVIDGAEKLEVTLNDNSKYNAKIVGTDPSTDLALLKVEATDLQAITFGDSDALKVGEWVLAVGNPFGFTSTVTAGIVSAKARSVSVGNNRNSGKVDIESFIQTDVAVNQGNSGGALVNTNGQLVGINSMIYSQTGSYAGISFAIPVSIVSKVINDIKQFGSVQRAVLGISYRELDADLAKENNITATKEGIYVAEVTDRGAAMEAGIKEGDVIVKVNNATVKNSGQMKEEMSKMRPGDKVTLSYYRNNKLCTTTATLKNNQGTTSVTKTNDFMSLGCAFKVLSPEKKKELHITSGVQVMGIKDGKFKDAGVKNGFVIIEINNSRVNNVDDVESIYNSIMQSSDSDKVMFVTGIYPTGRRAYYAVDLSE